LLKFSWNVIGPRNEKDSVFEVRDLACPQTQVLVDVPAATPERLRATRKRIEERIQQHPRWVRVVLGIEHAAFRELALQIHEAGPSSWEYLHSDELMAYLYQTASSPLQAHAELIQYITSPTTTNAYPVFDYWWIKEMALPAPELAQLAHSPKTWVKVMTLLTFAQQLDRRTKAGLLKDFANHDDPQRTARLQRLIDQLDDSQFATRQQATKELGLLGESAEAALQRALEGKPSLEAHRRIEGLLKSLQRSVPNADCRRVMAYLEKATTREAQEVLEGFARGAAASWWTREAQTVLERRANQAARKPAPALKP
jgi:hypothetical protein